MSLHYVVAVTRRRRPSVRPVRCSAAQENVSTRSGGVTATPTARMAVTKPTVVSKPAGNIYIYINVYEKLFL